MKYFLAICLMTLALVRCGTDEWCPDKWCADEPLEEPKQGEPGPQGPMGPAGPQGPGGEDGDDCTTTQFDDYISVQCGDYDPVFVYNGVQGSPGQDGADGVGCSIMPIDASFEVPNGGAAVTCGSTTVIIVNGSNGSDGEDGEDAEQEAYIVVEWLDPCGPSGGHDELFQRLSNGKLVSLFVQSTSALTARLSYLHDGVNYITTDNQACRFSINTSDGLRTLTTTSPISSTLTWNID